MSSRGRRVVVVAVWCVAVVVLSSCGRSDATSEREPFDVTVGPTTTVISLESELLGYPTAMTVAEDGQLWIADSQSKRIVAVAPDGADARSFGVEGQGPGEFRSPVAIVVGADTVRVFDFENNRVQLYGRDGTHIRDHIVATVTRGLAAVGTNGSVIAPTLGRDSTLATIYSLSDSSVVKLGPIVVAPPEFFDMRSMKARIADGTVPDEFRNQVSAVGRSTGGAWLLVQTEAEVRKYGPAGTLEWSRTLTVPEIEGARSEFFQKNAAEPNPARIYSLMTMSDAAEVAGNLWVLMQSPEGAPAVVYVLDGDTGETMGRITAELSAPARRIAVDVARKRLYLALPDQASVVAVDVSRIPTWDAP